MQLHAGERFEMCSNKPWGSRWGIISWFILMHVELHLTRIWILHVDNARSSASGRCVEQGKAHRGLKNKQLEMSNGWCDGVMNCMCNHVSKKR
jgi:hypothetical protein